MKIYDYVDNFLNRITMYRLVLYYLILLWLIAFIFSIIGILSYDLKMLLLTLFLIIFFSWVTNKIFAWAYNAPANVESIWITALILALIITPISKTNIGSGIWFIFWASVLSMASKFILAIGRKHVFNPAALAVAVTAISINQSASWWIGNITMAPFVFLGGILLVRKLIRSDLVLSFLITAISISMLYSVVSHTSLDLFNILGRILFQTSILFFAFVMLTEPLTTPPNRNLRIVYGILVGFLFAPFIHIGSFYSTPELALVIGNLFSYIVSPKQKLVLKLREKIQISPDVIDFVFEPNHQLRFIPGQYMEWTIDPKNADNRGNRRYLTIASSPTEDKMRIGVKFYQDSSSYKRKLLVMKKGDEIVSSQLAGDFVLPKQQNKKLVFIAGGIGITPFRSMIKYLSDRRESRDIILLFSNKNKSGIIYDEVFEKARSFGINTIYSITDPEDKIYEEGILRGRVDSRMIMEKIFDYKERIYYLSGPRSMILGFKETLSKLGISGKQIKTDFFPGFA
jgi:glycine betaine catabolism B